MPLDPSIILGAQPAPLQSPLQSISAIAQLQDVQAQTEQRRQAGEAARQKAMDDAQVRSVFAAAGGDTDAALKQLYLVNPRAAAPLAEQVGKARKEQLEAMNKGLETQQKQAELALQIARTVGSDGTGYGLARPAMVATSPVLEKILPPADAPWDPDRWSQILQAGVSGKDLLEHKQKVVDLFANGKVNEAVGTALSALKPDDPTAATQAKSYLDGAKALGAPEVILAPYRALFTPDGAWAPDASARAGQLAISPKERETLAGQAATRAQTAAHQTVEEQNAATQLLLSRGQLGVAQARERREAGTPGLVQVLQDGKPVWVPKAQAVGQPAAGGAAGRPATGAERQALAYYNRAQQASDTLTTPDATGKTLEDSVSGAGLKVGDLPVIGNYFQSQAAQAYQQAQRAFTEARLRKESGATIKDEEYASDRKTYFKQPNDSAATVEQKRLARQKVLNGLAFSSGKAYEEYYGTPFTRDTGTTPSATSSTDTRVRVVGPNGQTGTVPGGTALPPGWSKQ